MPKNILIFSDGTGQAGGLQPDQALSNVYKLFRACRPGPDSPIAPEKQVAFYDAGLGTVIDEGKIPIRPLQLYRKMVSSATGTGISRNIADCYEAILKHYEPGDRVFLFGFSRGAYTARCVGGVMSLCGIPTQAADGSALPRFGDALRRIADEAVDKVYGHGSGKDPASKYTEERNKIARKFREKYASGAEKNAEANVLPYFIGVFDTVAALGAPLFVRGAIVVGLLIILFSPAAFLAWMVSLLWKDAFVAALVFSMTFSAVAALYIYIRKNLKWVGSDIEKRPHWWSIPSWHMTSWRLRFYNTFLNKRIMFARHAIAIDENRKDFDRVPWDVDGKLVEHAPGIPVWLKQVWFSGNHSDIGGSYPEDESRLSDVALEWMVAEAAALPQPILINHEKLHIFPSFAGMQHSEISSMRDMYPHWFPHKLRAVWSRKIREVPDEAVLHPAVIQRFHLRSVSEYGINRPYRPVNLRNHHLVRSFSQSLTAPQLTDAPDGETEGRQ